MNTAREIKVANSTTPVGIALAKGDKVWDINAGVYYAVILPIAATATITTAAASLVVINAAGTSDAPILVSLPNGDSVEERITAAIEGTDYPNGWVLNDPNGIDLNIQHGLLKRVHSVTIWALEGDEEEELYGAARYSQILTPDSNNLLIKSLSVAKKRIQISILFR